MSKYGSQVVLNMIFFYFNLFNLLADLGGYGPNFIIFMQFQEKWSNNSRPHLGYYHPAPSHLGNPASATVTPCFWPLCQLSLEIRA